VMAMYSLVLTCISYVINLPFLILAFKSPFYRDRFEKLFCIEKTVAGCRKAPLPNEPISKEATVKVVGVGDLLGRWESYVDRCALTVRITFHADGKFSQAMVLNCGGIRECPGGTWRLDGADVHLDGYVAASGCSSEACSWWMIDTQDGFALYGGEDAESRLVFLRRT
jgi:hypothetical protein